MAQGSFFAFDPEGNALIPSPNLDPDIYAHAQLPYNFPWMHFQSPAQQQAFLAQFGFSEEAMAGLMGPQQPAPMPRSPEAQALIDASQGWQQRAGDMNALEPRRVRRDFYLPQELLNAQIRLAQQQAQQRMQDAQLNTGYSPMLARQLIGGI